MKKFTAKEIKNAMLENIETETPLRKWERRLLVALTDEAKAKCKAKIKEYSKSK
jgi:hypothetical protein